jgi:formylglycine-generating enzyme required for sulfatase activity
MPPEYSAPGNRGTTRASLPALASVVLVLLLLVAGGGAVAEVDDAEMVEIPAGDFLMGSDAPDADPDEQPLSRVFVARFHIDRHEATSGRYRRCVDRGVCSPPLGPAWRDPARADHPVVIVSWSQAATYCRWAGKRLPTEAEWEKAARGTDGRRYPWGDDFEAGRARAAGSAGTTAVGGHPAGASPYGVMDMAGNVWEWTASLYRPYPYVAGDGREDAAARGARVNRGGSWYYGAAYLRTSYRANADQQYRRVADLGFRCAR